MKILHINTESTLGGAAIAAHRHCCAMRRLGISATMLSLFGISNEFTIISDYNEKAVKMKRRWGWIKHKLQRLIIKKVAWHWPDVDYDISQIQEVKDADIIYIHWINDFLGYKAIKSLLDTGKPIIWYMHDMWPLTGGCHYSFDCQNYKTDCSNCPQMKILKNIPKYVLNKKIRSWNLYSNLYLAAPSIWLTKCIKDSALFSNHKVFTIPNVIDTDFFRPINKFDIRNKFKLPSDKKLILFIAVGVDNPYKGSKYLINTINKFDNCDYEFIVVGKCDISLFTERLRKKIHIMGYIESPYKMVEIYNCADVLLITSIAENFPNIVIEAMACGVPVVGFSTGGIQDQIKHKYNGWIVEPRNVDGLVDGINWILHDSNYNILQQNARNYVEGNYSYRNILNLHNQIFNLIRMKN